MVQVLDRPTGPAELAAVRRWTGQCECNVMQQQPQVNVPPSRRQSCTKSAVTWWRLPGGVLRLGGGVGRRLLQVVLVYLLLACWALWGGQVPATQPLLGVTRFASSEQSLADPLSLVSVGSVPAAPPPAPEPKNESLPNVNPKAFNATKETSAKVATHSSAKASKEGVSDATLPPDLIPRSHLPTSTPHVAPTEEPKVEKPVPVVVPEIPKPVTPTPEGLAKADTLQPPVTDSVKVLEDSPSPAATNASEETDQAEEIPSFNEWAQKKLADAEKRKVQNASDLPKTTPKPSNNLKVHSKNYASPDCGAKILAANPEAQSVSSVLSPSRDEYALNPCNSAKIWFVVELCEAIQAKQVELANFELFSSSPKEFSVWVSDRFPTREWHQLGQFTAQDERTVQTFPVDSHIFGKYVKVEQHSHWGSEHFCPVSLLRVYGTSEFEVLDEEGHGPRSPDDDGDDDDLTTVPGSDAPKNLFGSARDAVISIVKKAAQVLGKSDDSKNKTESDTLPQFSVSCNMSPLQGHECLDCSPAVQQLLVCQPNTLRSLLASSYVLRSLQQEQLCSGKPHNESYLATLLPTEYISALCHLLLALHKPQSTTATPNYDNLTLGHSQDPFLLLQPSETTTCHQEEASITSKSPEKPDTAQASVPPASASLPASISDVASQIKPTRTLKEDKMSDDSSASAPVIATLLPEVPAPPAPVAGSTMPAENSTVMAIDTAQAVEEESIDTDSTPKPTEEWPAGEQLDSMLAELKEEGSELDQPTVTPTSTESELEANIPPPPPANPSPTSALPARSMLPPQQGGQQKESVFVRLANRIKVLERNMSLSAQYLEELSRRYKRQVEEMQRAFEKTLAAVGEAARQANQREQAHAEQISGLEQRLNALAATTAALLAERDSWQHKVTVISQHLVLVAILVYLVVSLVRQCTPSAAHREPSPEMLRVAPIRRRSVDELRLLSGSRQRKRRSSEEAAICEQKVLIRMDSKGEHGADPSKKKRRKLRRELRGVSVEDLCSGLSPATLAAVRHPHHRPFPKQGIPPRLTSSPKCRRFSTESAPMLKVSWLSPPSIEVKMNGTTEEPAADAAAAAAAAPTVSAPAVDVITSEEVSAVSASPQQQHKKQSGLRKMVRKLF